jgi:hypothetical protein
MPTINQLPTITTLSGGDQLPVYATSNGDARKASISTLVEYFQATFADPNYTVVINAPTNSGFNIALGCVISIDLADYEPDRHVCCGFGDPASGS